MITKVRGIKLGHATDTEGITGCTVVLCEDGAVGGVDVRGGAPGTRETDLLRPMNLVSRVHAICLAGGSAFGLAAADGVMRYLEEHDIGFPTPAGKVPIVPAAIIYDLDVGDAKARPDAEMGHKACAAATPGDFEEGSVGAGTGATVGRIFGPVSRMKGGLGSASKDISGIVVGALAVANAFGDVISEDGSVLAGARGPEGGFLDTAAFLSGPEGVELYKKMGFGGQAGQTGQTGQTGQNAQTAQNTTLAVIATNAKLTKEEVNKLAQVAHDGLARSIRPVHTMLDGDVAFALATGEVDAPPGIVQVAAVEATAEAVRRAVRLAKSLGGVPALG